MTLRYTGPLYRLHFTRLDKILQNLGPKGLRRLGNVSVIWQRPSNQIPVTTAGALTPITHMAPAFLETSARNGSCVANQHHSCTGT